MEFTSQDLAQIKALGKQPEEVQSQLDRFVSGFPDIELYNIVSEGNGLLILSKEELKKYISQYEDRSTSKQLFKFVPASGAASRMFKTLYNFLDGQNDEQDEGVKTFFKDIDNFAFSGELTALMGNSKEELLKKRARKWSNFYYQKMDLITETYPKRY